MSFETYFVISVWNKIKYIEVNHRSFFSYLFEDCEAFGCFNFSFYVSGMTYLERNFPCHVNLNVLRTQETIAS
jgi:hypothetical protein